MLIELFGIILSLVIMLIFYYSLAMFLKTLNIKLPNFIENLDIVKWLKSKNKKEGMSNNSEDPLEKSIMKTQNFNKLPEAFADKETSFFSFLSNFDRSFKPPKYQNFPYKSTLYTVDYNCRPSATGMFTNCGPMASNSCH